MMRLGMHERTSRRACEEVHGAWSPLGSLSARLGQGPTPAQGGHLSRCCARALSAGLHAAPHWLSAFTRAARADAQRMCPSAAADRRSTCLLPGPAEELGLFRPSHCPRHYSNALHQPAEGLQAQTHNHQSCGRAAATQGGSRQTSLVEQTAGCARCRAATHRRIREG